MSSRASGRRIPTLPLARWAFCSLLILAAIFSAGFGPGTLTESESASSPVLPTELRLLLQSQPPNFTGKATLVMDENGRVVFQRNSQVRLAPASLTKVMTGIVALENGDLSSKITIKWQHTEIGSSMGLAPGDVVSLEDLLWGLLLPSGNDAAKAIADLIAGSEEGFIAMMNEKASALGLKNTHFENPHGLDEDNHYSSAYDMAVITRYALSFPVFARMVSTPRYELRSGKKVFYLINANGLLTKQLVPGIDGVKTGYTGKAGQSLISSFTDDGHRFIVVVMGTQDRDRETIPIIEYIRKNFYWVKPPPPLFRRFTDIQGHEREVRWEAPTFLLPKWERYRLSSITDLQKRSNPYTVENPVGAVDYFLAGRLVQQSPLYVSP